MIADVLAVNPKSIALDAAAVVVEAVGEEDATSGVEKLNLTEESDGSSGVQSVEEHLIQQFYSAKLSHPGLVSILPKPQLLHIDASTGPKLALQLPRESAAHKTEFDEYFIVDDPKVHGKSKMKKAFCEPGNVEFCPPIELLAYFGGLDSGGKEVTISRSPENGGDVTYTTKAA